MNELNIYKSNWSKKKEHLLKIFKELSDEDLYYQQGNEDELVERVQKRLGITHHGARQIIRIA